MRALTALAIVALLRVSSSAEEPSAQQQMIDRLKDFESTLGFHKTGNFAHRSETVKAYYRCYYTGKLELPDSYDHLRLRQGDQSGCSIDPQKYDVFFYPLEAVGSGRSPVTESLEHSPVERVLMVIPHEDFHGRQELPETITEAAATLIGFLTASEFAREKFGADSPVYRNLSQEAELFLRKAEIVNRYYARLSALYGASRSRKKNQEHALAEKAKLFRELGEECGRITPAPSSFNKCVSASNNAGLAFDRTYTKHYPLMYQLFRSRGGRLQETVTTLKQFLVARFSSEDDAGRSLRAMIGH